jgi:hemerythrin superfamily protein
MDIYSALKKDHQKVSELLDRLVASSDRGTDEWKELVTQIRDELIPHSRAEEALFYNPLRQTEHGKEVVAHSYGEHAMAETELRALQAMKAIDANWNSLVRKLRSDLLHHVEEEESKVFAAAQVAFSAEDAQNIGEAFGALKPFVKEQSFVGTSFDLVMNLLPESIRTKLQTTFAKARKKAA